MPDAPWDYVRRCALIAGDVLTEHGLTGYPKTSGSRGMHIPVRIEQRWDFPTVRRAALNLANEVARRADGMATAEWFKNKRPSDAVFVDYNQNAKDHTVVSAYSVRPVPDARVSAPLFWDEVADVEPADLTLKTVPQRLREKGDPSADIETTPGALDSLLALEEDR